VKAGTGVALAVVRDLRAVRPVPDEVDLDAFEQDLIAGFVLARSAAGVTDKSIQAELRAVGEFRESMGRHLWTARPDDADRLLGQRCRGQAKATIAGKAFAISVFFQYLELRHQVEIHALTGEIVQCPIDEMNRPRDDWSRWISERTTRWNSTFTALRQDRILEEATAAGTRDPMHLASMFGLHPNTRPALCRRGLRTPRPGSLWLRSQGVTAYVRQLQPDSGRRRASHDPPERPGPSLRNDPPRRDPH
jgi:hypothetical protein